MNRSGHNQTKKSVSYMPLPTNIKRRNSDDLDDEENFGKESSSNNYKYSNSDLDSESAIPKDKHNLLYYREDEFLKCGGRSNNKYATLFGHRRAESLGNVGQTHWNCSSSSPLSNVEQGEEPFENHQGKAFQSSD